MQTQSMQSQSAQQTITATQPPTIITTKDMAYLEDAMSWLLVTTKKCAHYAAECQDSEVKQLLDQIGQMHQRQYNTMLSCCQSSNAAQQVSGQSQQGSGQAQQVSGQLPRGAGQPQAASQPQPSGAGQASAQPAQMGQTTTAQSMGQQQTAGTKIESPQAKASHAQAKGPQLSDTDRLTDILTTEKHLTANFNIATYEASHQQLHRDMMQILTETHWAARQAYELLFKKGEYSLSAAGQQEMGQTAQKFQGYKTQLPYPAGQMGMTGRVH